MVRSSTSRIVGLVSATLLLTGAIEFLIFARFIATQRTTQVAGILVGIPGQPPAKVERVRADLEAIAPGSLLYLLDTGGNPIQAVSAGPVPQSVVDWARSCIANRKVPCMRGNLIAVPIPAPNNQEFLAVVAVARTWPNSLLVWLILLPLTVSVVLGFCIDRLVNAAFGRSLGLAFESVLPSSLSASSPCWSQLPTEESVTKFSDELAVRIRGLEEARQRLLRDERTHLEWIAYLSHDLATPLSRMLRQVESMQYDEEMSEQEKETTLEAVHREITDLAEIVGSISQFAILESNIERDFFDVPFRTLLEHTVEEFDYEASTRDIELTLCMADDIGTVRIEKTLVKRALVNLIVNALRHTPTGGFIRVKASLSDGHVQIAVEDNGPGIPPEEAERIFNFAFRGEGETRISKVGAMGLGLALVKRVAAIHSGSVAVANVEPHGARFILSLKA